VLQKVGIGQQAHQELTLLYEEPSKVLELHTVGLDIVAMVVQPFPDTVEVLVVPFTVDEEALSGKMAILCILKGADGGL